MYYWCCGQFSLEEPLLIEISVEILQGWVRIVVSSIAWRYPCLLLVRTRVKSFCVYQCSLGKPLPDRFMNLLSRVSLAWITHAYWLACLIVGFLLVRVLVIWFLVECVVFSNSPSQPGLIFFSTMQRLSFAWGGHHLNIIQSCNISFGLLFCCLLFCNLSCSWDPRRILESGCWVLCLIF